MLSMKDQNRERALAEVERIRRHLKNLGRKTFRGVYVFADGKNFVRIYYRRDMNAKAIPLQHHPIKEPDAFYAEVMSARNGGPTGGGEPFMGTRQNRGSHEAGTVNATLDVLKGSSDYAEKSDSTKKAYNSSIEAVRAAFGSRKLVDLKPYQFEQLCDEAVAKKKNVVNLITVLRKVYEIGHSRQWTKLDLMAGVHLPKKKLGAEDAEGYRPWTLAEVEAWRREYSIGSMPRLVMELAYQSLGRSEIVRLAPHHISTDDNGVIQIELPRRKRGSSVQNWAVVEPDLIACLAALPAPAADEPVDIQGRSMVPLVRQKRGAPYAKGDTDHALTLAAAGLGVDWQRWRKKIGLPVDFNIHGGRKTFAVDCADADIDERASMAAMGHNDNRVHRHYAAKRDRRRAGALASVQVAEARQQRRAAYAAKVVAIR